MRRLNRGLALLIGCAAALPQIAGAAQLFNLFGDDDAEKKEFVEGEVKLPAAPKAENLLPFEASAASSNRLYLDAQSITMSDDRMVRYTLVVRSPSGVDNVSYEGIRCETREQKTYAYGRRDGTWVAPRTSEWQPIESTGTRVQHRVLYREYFCPIGGAVRSPKDIIGRLKYGVPTNEVPPGGNLR